jgi:hypothetical protein
LEIIGNFMYSRNAYLQLLALLRSGQLDKRLITPKVFPTADFTASDEVCRKGAKCVVLTTTDRG